MLPDWMPNLHPLVIHFPIVFALSAVIADGLDVAYRKPEWLRPMATSLYAAGGPMALVAYWTGSSAASTVFIPGMAHPLVDDHRAWALAATIAIVAVAAAHVATHLFVRQPARLARIGLALAGLAVLVLVQQTAERGGRLVYEQGVGVIRAPESR